MSTFTDKIRVVLDVDKNAGTKALKSFRTDMQQAQGVAGKFKVVTGAAGSALKDNMGAAAMAAGTAIAAYGVKAFGAFQDVAKAARETATATGLTVEQASRWNAVADDVEVGAETVQKALLQIVKGLDKPAWEQYGIATRDAAGDMRDTNEIMLDAFDALSKIPEGSERAAAGNKLFGKSYADLSPMIGKSRNEYEKMLAAVEDGQVITNSENETSKRAQAALDELGDSVNEVTLAFGQQVAKFAPVLSGLADLITFTTSAQSKLHEMGVAGKFAADGLGLVVNPIGTIGDVLDDISGKSEGVAFALGGPLVSATGEVIGKTEEATAAAKALAEQQGSLASFTKNAATSMQQSGDATSDTVGWWVTAEVAAALLGDAVAQSTPTLDAFNRALAQSQGALSDAKDGLGYVESMQSKFARAALEGKEALDKEREAATDLGNALGETLDALTALRNKQMEGIDAARDFEAASDAASDAQRDLADVMADSESTFEDIDDAARDAADAAIAAAESYSTLGGNAAGSAGDIQAQIDMLTLQASTLADGSPLKVRLQAYIDALKGIPTAVATNVTIGNYDSTVERLRQLQRQLDGLAKGIRSAGSQTPAGGAHGTEGQTSRASGSRTEQTTRGARGESAPAGFQAPSDMSSGDFVSSGIAGTWEAAGSAVADSVDDQLDAMDTLMARKRHQNVISEDEYLAYLRTEEAAAVDFTDRQAQLFDQIADIEQRQADQREQLAADEAQRQRDAQADQDEFMAREFERNRISYQEYASYLQGRLTGLTVNSDAEYALWKMLGAASAEQAARVKADSDAQVADLDRVTEALQRQVAAAYAAAESQHDLEEAAELQAQSMAALSLVQTAFALGTTDAGQLAEYTDRAADATYAGAKARAAANGLQPGTAAYAQFVRSEIENYLKGPGAQFGGAFADELRQNASALPDIAVTVPVNIGGVDFGSFTARISAEQVRQSRGAT